MQIENQIKSIIVNLLSELRNNVRSTNWKYLAAFNFYSSRDFRIEGMKITVEN